VSGLSQPAGPVRAPRWKFWLAPLADAFVAVTLLRGVTAHEGRPATMLVAGREKRVRWLIERFFAAPPERETRGHVPAWRLARTLRQARGSADLTVAHLARASSASLGFGDDYLPVPDWIGMRLVAPFAPDGAGRLGHDLSLDLRRVRLGRWAAEVSHRASDFTAFYRDMYVPYVRGRHGADAYIQSDRRLRRTFRQGGLLWVSRDGERRAGLLFEHRQGTLVSAATGAAGDPARPLREGAIAATYVHMLDYARSAGCAEIDLRGSRPSLDDGVTRYKRKWGASVYDRPDVLTTTLVHWHRMTPAAREFLAHTSLVFRDGGALSALVVARQGEQAGTDPGDTWTRLGIPGLRRMIVVGATTSEPHAGAAGSRCVVFPFSAIESGPRALLVPAND
jgi:hypothetical protein